MPVSAIMLVNDANVSLAVELACKGSSIQVILQTTHPATMLPFVTLASSPRRAEPLMHVLVEFIIYIWRQFTIFQNMTKSSSAASMPSTLCSTPLTSMSGSYTCVQRQGTRTGTYSPVHFYLAVRLCCCHSAQSADLRCFRMQYRQGKLT